MPIRIQRRRTKGWRAPEGAIYVGRPSWFGNPFTPEDYWNCGYSGNLFVARHHCVTAYRQWLTGAPFTHHWREPKHFLDWLQSCRAGRVERIHELRGKDLMCWCGLGFPCHADVLLEIANEG